MIKIAITDPALPSPETWVEAAVDLVARADITWLHLRARALPHPARAAAAARLSEACRRAGVKLMINTDLDIARAIEAEGLHLPAAAPLPAPHERAGLTLSRACHDLRSVLAAQDQGFDMVTLSPVFPPGSKRQDARPCLGIGGLAQVCGAVRVPVIALGGMDAGRARRCVAAGAAGAAGIGWFFRASSAPP